MKKLVLALVLFLLSLSFTSAQCWISQIAVNGPTTFCSGDSVELSVFGSAPSGPATYQWYHNNSFIWGATSWRYYATVSGSYSCQLTNSGCWFVSSPALTVQVNTVPVVSLTANGSTTVCSGSAVTLSAAAGTSFTNQYQWQLNGLTIPGATSASYSATSPGDYISIVSNACGIDTSGILHVDIVPTPVASINSSGPTILCNGGTVVLLTDTGSNYSYTWYRNNSTISGMTLSNYLVTSEGNYKVKVTDINNNCFRNSAAVAVTLGPMAVSVTASPVSPMVCAGTSVTLTASANVAVSSYQWKKNGILIPLATSSHYTFSAQSISTYTVDVTNGCGTVTSAGYTPAILQLPAAVITASSPTGFCAPDSVVLNAMTGVNYTYQWYANTGSTPVTGAIDPFYTATGTGNYYVKVTDSSTSCNANSNVIRVSSNGLAAFVTPSGTIRACDSLVLTANGDTSFSYQWRVNGVNIPGATSQTYTALTIGVRNYDVIITGGCGTNASNVVNVTLDSIPYPAQTVLIFISPSTCVGLCGSYSLTMCEGLKASIGFDRWFQHGREIIPLWYVNGDSILNPPAFLSTSNYYNWILRDQTTPGIYYCDISNACGVTRSNSVTLSVNPATSIITAGGPTTFCPGGSVTLNANTGTGLLYQWRNSGLQIPGAIDSTYAATQAGTYTCIVSNPAGCNTLSNFINVSVSLPTPLITASGPTNFCAGSPVDLNVAADSGSTYQWNLNGVPIPGATSASFSADSAGTYTCSISSSCGNTLSDTIALTQAYSPSAAITAGGSITFCPGDSVALIANAGTGLSYQWQLNGGNIPGAIASSYYAKAAGNYTCIVTNSCDSIGSNQIAVAVNAAPVASIVASDSTFCSGDSTILLANTATGYSYQWQLNGGTLFGATSSSYSATAAGNYTCIVTNSCGNQTSNQISVTMNAAPIATIVANDSTTFCSGDSAILQCNTATGYTYQWQLNGGDIAWATFSFYSVTVAGNYTCVVTNSCGNQTSNQITVTVNPLPAASITAMSATTFCTGGSVTLNANSGSGLIYQWQLNGGNIPGAVSASYTAPASGDYSCMVSNSCGSVASNSITVTQLSVPNTPGFVYGITLVNPGASGVVYSVAPVNHAASYQWTVPPGLTITGGQGTNSITVNFPSLFLFGIISVRASNVCGISAIRNKTVGGCINGPPVPVPLLPPASPRVMDGSDSDGQDEDEWLIEVFPNPTNNYFTIKITSDINSTYFLSIKDLSGREIGRKENISVSENVDFGFDLSNGIYFAEVIRGNSRKILKLVKNE